MYCTVLYLTLPEAVFVSELTGHPRSSSEEMGDGMPEMRKPTFQRRAARLLKLRPPVIGDKICIT
jgi:hypothetical protein